MKVDFICDYLHNFGKICGKACTHFEGYHFHFKARKCHPCTKYGKLTGTICD